MLSVAVTLNANVLKITFESQLNEADEIKPEMEDVTIVLFPVDVNVSC